MYLFALGIECILVDGGTVLVSLEHEPMPLSARAGEKWHITGLRKGKRKATMSRSRKGRGGKLPALSEQELEAWRDGTFDDADDDSFLTRRGYLDESFAEANEASVSMQWSNETLRYEPMGNKKDKKASAEQHVALAANQSKQTLMGGMAYYPPRGTSTVVDTLSKADKCSHEGITAVLTIPSTGTQVFAASSGFAREASYLCDMAIDVGAHITDSNSTNPFVQVRGVCSEQEKQTILALNAQTISLPPIVKLDWPDMGIPPAGLAFWRALINILPPQGKVVVACMGSHGRTGTTLAALLIVSQGMIAREAIDYVRRQHCKKAIESLAQEKYLQSLSDAMVRDKGREQAR